MLRDNDRKYVESLKTRYQIGNESAMSGKERVKMHRIRAKAHQAVIDLSTLTRALPEDQAEQIFTVERLRPLIEALVLGSRDDSSLPRQLSLAEMFIEVGAKLTRRLTTPRLGGDIGLALDQVQTVLLAARMAMLKQ